MSSPLRQRSFVQTIVPLAKTLQFYWFVGHVSSLSFFVLNVLFSFVNRSKALSFYRLTLVSVIVTYSIVIKQVHFKKGTFDPKLLMSPKYTRDENFQYLTLAVIFLVTSFKIGAVSGGLYSFLVFSIFHVLTYFQNYILSSLPISLSLQQAINSKINAFTSQFNQQALLVAANCEVFLPLGFILQIPALIFALFRDPVFVLVNVFVLAAVVVFVKLRYNDNKFTRDVIHQWDYKISSIVNSPQLQAYPLANIYQVKFKSLLNKYLGPIRISPTSKKSQ